MPIRITGGAITSINLLNQSITTVKIADNAVTAIKIASGVVDNSKLAQMPAFTIKGNNGVLPSAPLDLTPAQVGNMFGAFGITSQTIYWAAGVGSGRVIGQVYQNTNNRSMFLKVALYLTQNGSEFKIVSDVNSVPTTEVDHGYIGTAGATSQVILSCYVPILVSNYYEVINMAGSMGIYSWVEYV
jgi:hypothetical protein